VPPFSALPGIRPDELASRNKKTESHFLALRSLISVQIEEALVGVEPTMADLQTGESIEKQRMKSLSAMLLNSA
jgi:hypothetical protein